MSKIQSVAVAGASGSLGKPLTQALLSAGFTVTALTRPDSNSAFPSTVNVARVDYSSKESLHTALQGHDALIIALATEASDQQTPLIEAAVAAGVQRIIPSEFGSDTLHPRARALPVFKAKIEVQALLERLCDPASGGHTTYTLVLNSAFLDWGIQRNFLIDLGRKSFELFDGGEGYFTTTPLSFIAAGVVAVLQNPAATANRAVHLQGARLTQRKFLEIAQRVVGAEGWTVKEVQSESLEKECLDVLEREPWNVPGWVFGMLKLCIFAARFGGDFEESNDNEMLGLKQLGETEVEEIFRGCV